MDDVVSTVDALVSDEPMVASHHYGIDSPLRSGTPSFPPGFGHIQPLQYPTPLPPPGFSRPMTPAALTPINPSSLSRLHSSTSVMSHTDLVARKQTQDALEQHAEQQQQALNLSDKKETTSRIVSGSTNVSGIDVSATESTKPIRTIEFAASSTLPDHEASVPATPISKSATKATLIQDEDFPALDATTISAVKSSAAAIQARPSKPSTPVRKKTTEKRPTPTVLNITTVTRPVLIKDNEASPVATEKYTTADSVAFPSLPTPSVPLSPVVRSMPQHKTLRVVQASKADAASAGPATLSLSMAENAKSAASTSSTPITTPAALTNRQSSALMANRPSTPASEIVSISDNASVVSASISASRAGSPPPTNSRIGSAAVRTTTKSQQRKQRKQATRNDVAAVVEAATTTSSAIVGPSTNEQEEDAEIIPILGRKKKQKKEKPVSVPARTAETNATTPESAPTTSTKEQKETKGAKHTHVARKDEASILTSAAAELQTTKATETSKIPSRKSADSIAVTATAPAEEPAATVTAVATASASSATTAITAATAATESPTRRSGTIHDLFEKEQEILRVYLREAAKLSITSTLGVKESSDNHSDGYYEDILAMDQRAKFDGTLHSVVQKLVARGLIDQNLDKISLLQPFPRLSSPRDNDRQHPIQGDALLPPDVLFQKEDVSDILSGKVVRKHVDGVRILLTPNGDCLRSLTEAEEERFLALQSLVGKEITSLLSFKSIRYDEPDGFALLFKRAISSGLPPYYPVKPKSPPGTTGHIFDPLSKIQREEALHWINQYVLPRLNLLPQSEAASWQSILMDTGVPQAIGSTTLAPWIYHSPEKLCSVSTDATSSRTPADSVATIGRAREDVRVDGVPSPYPTRYSSRFWPTAGRDILDMRKELDSSVNAMTVEDAERSLIEARREVKVFERALMQLVKVNEMLLKNEDDDQPAQLALGPEGHGGSGSGSGSGTEPVAAPAPVAAAAY